MSATLQFNPAQSFQGMCGYMFIFTDPMELAGAEMIAADQAVLVDAF